MLKVYVGCMILHFLIACSVFCVMHGAGTVQNKVFSVAESDHQIYANVQDGFYEKGSVWVRTSKDNPSEGTVYYRPGATQLYYERGFSINRGPKPQERHRQAFWEDITQRSDGKSWQTICSEKYKVSSADLTCAATVYLREFVAGRCIYDGVQYPEFHSWARYMSDNDCEAINYIGRQELYGVCSQYALGDMWIAQEGRRPMLRPMLFYRPDFGPDWMYYRYDLTKNAGWPKNWLPELELMRKFVASEEYRLIEYTSPQKVDKTIAAAKAVLSGRTAGWNEDVWCAWQPQCQENDPFLKVHKNDLLHTGKAKGGFYQPGSTWMTRWPLRKTACRTLTNDRSAFQIATANFPDSSPEVLWLAPSNGGVALEFINGGNKWF